MNLILISMGVLGVVALLAAILLYVVSLYFKVEEDPRIDLVAAVLPGANCGGCGFAGCRNFAEACVKAGGIDGLACPVGGDPTMEQVKLILTPADAQAETPAFPAPTRPPPRSGKGGPFGVRSGAPGIFSGRKVPMNRRRPARRQQLSYQHLPRNRRRPARRRAYSCLREPRDPQDQSFYRSFMMFRRSGTILP